MTRRRHGHLAVLLGAALLAAGCGRGSRPEFTSTTLPVTTTTTTAAPTTTTTTAPFVQPAAPDGRVYPAVAADRDTAIARLLEVETLLHDIEPTDPRFADLAHEQQVLYREIGRHRAWVPRVIETAPEELRAVVTLHLAARQAVADIGSGEAPAPRNIPAWDIIEPLGADELKQLYDEAEAATGVDWTFLAAINLIETGFGRIHGNSTAGAQGPMQFLPSTWEEVSDGDIDDPHDAIPAAARYLVRRGAPDDMHAALFGYNNSVAYVAAVTHYANLFALDERSYVAAHAWEIHYSAAAGDLWLPVGLSLDEVVPVVDYLRDAPWSAPPPPA